MEHPRPKPGARDSSDADASLVGDAIASSKSRASVQARLNGRRAHFARQATIDAFEWRYAMTLDQADFIAHPPRKTVRLLGVSSALRLVVGSS